jgi:hypothetical protein
LNPQKFPLRDEIIELATNFGSAVMAGLDPAIQQEKLKYPCCSGWPPRRAAMTMKLAETSG